MCQHSIANIDINKDYDESLGTEEVHYQSFSRMAAFFGRDMQAHRHDRYFQMHYLDTGQIELQLDDHRYSVQAPLFVITPPSVPHAFITESDSDGHVLTVHEELIWPLLEVLYPGTRETFGLPGICLSLADKPDELAALVTKYMMSDDYQEYKSRAVGELNDFKIVLMHQGALVSLSLKANGHYTCDYSMSGLGGVTRLCNLYERIPEQIHGLTAELEQAKKQLANAKEQYGKPFQYEEQLRAGLERQAQINAELEVADKPHDEAVMGDYSNDENEEMEM